LTERGREQALILAEKLLEIPFTAIYSSPVLRARETADILSGSLGRAYQVTEALREYDCGVLEDRSDEESWKQHRKYYEDWVLRHDFLSRPEGGESFVDIQNRFLPFIEALKNEDEGHILLIGHGGIFHLMLPLILTDIDNDFVRSHGIGHTECIVAELHSDGFICRQWGAVRF
jgi:probable phosphoglycerate mutase